MRPRIFSESQAVRLISVFEAVSRYGKERFGYHYYNQYDAARDLIVQSRSCWEVSDSGRYRISIPGATQKLAKKWSITEQEADELVPIVAFMTRRALVQQLKRWRARVNTLHQVHNHAP